MHNVEQLRTVLPQLPPSDQSFARSLIDAATRFHQLTPKQALWVDKLVERVVQPQPPGPVVVVVGVGRIRRMFDSAAAALKHPKIWMGTPESPIRLPLAGARSRYAGQIMVTDGAPFGHNRFYGSIDASGVLTPGRDLTPAVQAELHALAADPEAHAAAFGKLTGHCCFCNRALDDDRSVDVGYGPVCAKNFGLVWGGK